MQVGLVNDEGPALAESISQNGNYRYRLFVNDVVAVQKPSLSSPDGWNTAYIIRRGVCPCPGFQYREDCKHISTAQGLIKWWAENAPPPAPPT